MMCSHVSRGGVVTAGCWLVTHVSGGVLGWLLSFLVHFLVHHVWLGHLLLILWLLEGVAVVGDDADEVSEECVDHGGDVKAEDDLLLSGGLEETDSVVSGFDSALLVPEKEVAGIPNSEQSDRDDGQDAGTLEVSARVWGIFSEEDHDEHGRDDEWDGEGNTNGHIPPVNIVIQKLVEYLEELDETDKKDEYSNSDNSTFDWEEAAASEFNSSWL